MIPVLTQFKYFLWTMALGVAMAFGFDFYRAVKNFIKLPRWLVNVCDLIFWLVATISAFIALIYVNWGEVRFYVLIGIVVGGALYYKTAGNRIIIAWIKIFDIIKKLFVWLTRIIKVPARLMKKLLAFPLGLITFILYKISRTFRRAGSLVKKPVSKVKLLLIRLIRSKT